ncbi:pyridoxal phosphate-dependent aminotransferase [Phytomonospora endophytica]|uniref:Aspartate/methionine/tyrosine aminotransferase n=1 Tax=Phytomonospora endophytica TaxID=714109 RepID=A0A841FHV3_9ACTN|nr:pyridoxal phosphate-dependent aminotransferase [Phytomonospora endophytica]MBB6032239.1 aspartate/methionine/tyrosine aminotransferase [Phytomonospora endophytica]
MTIGRPSLTDYERNGIDRKFDLGAGYARQGPDRAQQRIIDSLPMLYARSMRMRQTDVEATFQRLFYGLAGQFSATHRKALMCYSASQAIELAAMSLAKTGRTVGLLQPSFDVLAASLRRQGVPLVPVAEENATEPEGLGALFLTLPNNPTGFTLGRSEFEKLVRRCAENDVVLIVDWTFRFYAGQPFWDQYEVLDDSGVTYMCIEDTGKTWSMRDLKCGILASSPDLFDELAELHGEMLLNVSPFTLSLLSAYLADSSLRGLDTTVTRLIRANRAALREALADTILVPGDAGRTVSVEWVRVDSDELTGGDIADLLGHADVTILPGDQFYWHDTRLGSPYVRIALARDPVVFAEAARRIADALPQRPGREAS